MKEFPRRKNRFIILVSAIFFVFCAIGICFAVAYLFRENRKEVKVGKSSETQTQEWEGEDEESQGPEERAKLQEPVGTESEKIPSALENFGKYLEELYREGRRTELDSQVISRRLSLKEAALMAEGAPLLEHIKAYEEDELMIVTGGICILAADVNGDGQEDLIEYGPDAENADTANMLNIYLGQEGGRFELSYSQPLFSTMVEWSDIIEVVRHEEETYLLFRDRTRSEYSGWKEEGVLAAYWLLGGRPMGKLNLDYICSDVNMTVTESAGVWDASFLTENRLSLYHVDYRQHCKVECDWLGSKHGSGETEIFPRQDEETNDDYEVLCDGYVRKYRAQQEPYAGEWAGDPQWHYNITGMTTMYESDLNNDGVTEKYLKAVKALWMCESGFLSLGYSSDLPHITGEYYGIHEGRYGLMYYIESEGEETDFFKMCGLDIWAGEMTPLYFWVEQTERGNVTYISYQDGDEHRQCMEGYLIQGDSYERVLCAEYVPQIECSVSYKAMDESDGVDYIICRARDRRSFELEWEDENELQESVNCNIKVLLEEKMGNEAFLEEEEWKYMTVRYHPVEATMEKLVVDCMIFYNDPNNTPAMDHSQNFRVSINLETGKCGEAED